MNLRQQQGSSWCADSNVMMSPSAHLPCSSLLLMSEPPLLLFSFSLYLSFSISVPSVLLLVPQSFYSFSLSRCLPLSCSISARACLWAHLTKHSIRESQPCLTWHVEDSCEERSGHTLLTAEGKAPLLQLMRLLTAVSNTLCVYVCDGVCASASTTTTTSTTKKRYRCRNNEQRNKKAQTNQRNMYKGLSVLCKRRSCQGD